MRDATCAARFSPLCRVPIPAGIVPGGRAEVGVCPGRKVGLFPIPPQSQDEGDGWKGGGSPGCALAFCLQAAGAFHALGKATLATSPRNPASAPPLETKRQTNAPE